MFPKALGVLLIMGGTGYLWDTVGSFLAIDFGESASALVVMPAAFAELWMVGYLLVKGVRDPGTTPKVGETVPIDVTS